MKPSEQEEFFRNHILKYMTLGIKRDLSLTPEIFGQPLRVKGLFIWGRAKHEDSITLSNIEFDVILYNETAVDKVDAPQGYELFQIRDLQEFPYTCAVKVHVKK